MVKRGVTVTPPAIVIPPRVSGTKERREEEWGARSVFVSVGSLACY